MPGVPSLGPHLLYRALDRLARPDCGPQEFREFFELLLEVLPLTFILDLLEKRATVEHLLEHHFCFVRIKQSIFIEVAPEPLPVVEPEFPDQVPVVVRVAVISFAVHLVQVLNRLTPVVLLPAIRRGIPLSHKFIELRPVLLQCLIEPRGNKEIGAYGFPPWVVS